jgi:7-carboxy-7-deazaguanine synthase
MNSLVVNEIFHSIQGESSQAGFPCVFVRLTACNLRCTWCDSEYSFYEGTRMSVAELLERVEAFGCRLVELTGGEPLLQEGALELMAVLCDRGYDVMLETGGALSIAPVDPRVRRIVDIKCPGSGMSDRNFWGNIAELKQTDELKFVLRDRADFDWAVARISEHGLEGRCPLLFSPVFGELEPVTLAGWILESRIPVRLQLQLHKFIWEPSTRGV